MPHSHMSTVEVATMDRMQKTGHPPQAILATLHSARAKRGANGPSQTAVYRFLNGSSYARGQEERRGCLEKMHSNIQAAVAPKGCHTTLD